MFKISGNLLVGNIGVKNILCIIPIPNIQFLAPNFIQICPAASA